MTEPKTSAKTNNILLSSFLFNKFEAEVTKVVDGDTLDLTIFLGFDVSVNIRVRLFGIDTPEVHGVKKESKEYKKGIKASEFVHGWLDDNGSNVVVETFKQKKGKYGRWIARIYSKDESKILNEDLFTSGNARKVIY